jgi:hypothetical protein
MAYVVARGHGRFEVRESARTERGPRARTLAAFRELTPEVLAAARAKARSGFDEEALRDAARRMGAPVAAPVADAAASELYRELARGARLRPALARLIAAQLNPGERPSDAELAAGEWLGRSAEERGRVLVDLLGLADAIPKRRREPELRFPPVAAG